MKPVAYFISMLILSSLGACAGAPDEAPPCAGFCEDRCAYDECKDECSDQVCEGDVEVGSHTDALSFGTRVVGAGGGVFAMDTYPYTCPQWCFDQCHRPGTPITDAVKKCFDTCKTDICKGKI